MRIGKNGAIVATTGSSEQIPWCHLAKTSGVRRNCCRGESCIYGLAEKMNIGSIVKKLIAQLYLQVYAECSYLEG